jgi:undecaprenol kinase/diacylglycerol kinase (ATP)
MSHNLNFRASLRNAFNGLIYIFTTQRNAKIHSVITTLVLIASVFFHIAALEWIAVIFAIGFVWASECLNTAIEKLTDLASPDYHELAKASKDTAAAAVLVAAFTSVVIGLVIFLPKLLALLNK